MTTGCSTKLPVAKLPVARLLTTVALCVAAIVGHAQTADPLPPETVLVAASGAPAATQETFSIAAVAAGATQPTLLVTFTDLQTPAALSAASVVVTQGDAIVAMATLPAGATTMTLMLPAAVGQYALRVIGTPSATAVPSAGSFQVCVAPETSPTACIADASIAGSVGSPSATTDPTQSTLSLTLTVATAGSYTFTYADAQFPVALQAAPTLALFEGSEIVEVPIPPSPAAITLAPGTYTLLAFAQADATAKAGLYGITIAGSPDLVCQQSTTPIPCSNSYPVGLLGPASPVSNPTAQTVLLSATDFAFPAPLASAGAALTAGGTVLGVATAGAAAASLMAPSGALQVWSYAAAGASAGTYEVDLSTAAASLLQADIGVSGGGVQAYAVVTAQALQAASYVATANDFQFPAALTNLQFAVAQNGAILQQSSAAGSVNFTAVAAPAVFLAAATPATDGAGLLDLNIQTGGSAPQVVFDQVQPVSASGGFSAFPITLAAAGNYDVSLTDLQFPAQFSTLALIGSSNGAVLGKVYGGGTFTLAAASGSLQFFVVAIPAAAQQYGLYGLQILNSPPTVTLTASPTTLVAGGSTTLSWTTTNATACTASGGTFAGSQNVGSGMASITVSATTTYTLTCTGPGGTGSDNATVTATPAPATTSSGGGGSIAIDLLCLLGALFATRLRSTMPSAAPAG